MAVTVPVEECRSNASFEEIMLRMRSSIERYAASRVGIHRAGDIYSDVCLAALVAWRQDREINEPWLMTVARNKAIDHVRRSVRTEVVTRRVVADRSLRRNPSEFELEQFDFGDSEVSTTLSGLPMRHRSILVRHYVEGVPLGEIAAQDSVSYQAIESAIARARRSFRRRYESA